MGYDLTTFLLGLYLQALLLIWGFVLPLITALISLFPEATKLLSEKYQNEVKQSEENLIQAVSKKDSNGNVDTKNADEAIQDIKNKKNSAESKLAYLNPKYAVLRISLFFFLTVSIGAATLLIKNQNYLCIAYFASLLFLYFALNALWFMFIVLIEATEVNNLSRKEYETKNIELLSQMVEQTGENKLFIDATDVVIDLDKKALVNKKKFTYSLNNEHSFDVSLINTSEKMIKNSELGFKFPKEFILEKTADTSLYSGKDYQVVRYNSETVQADENRIYIKLKFKPLRVGSFKVSACLKAESIKPVHWEIVIEVFE